MLPSCHSLRLCLLGCRLFHPQPYHLEKCATPDPIPCIHQLSFISNTPDHGTMLLPGLRAQRWIFANQLSVERSEPVHWSRVSVSIAFPYPHTWARTDLSNTYSLVVVAAYALIVAHPGPVFENRARLVDDEKMEQPSDESKVPDELSTAESPESA